MIDYVLVNRCFRTSILDTHVFRSTYVESDHELVVSTIRFKIKKGETCVQNKGPMKRYTLEMRIRFKVALAAAVPSQPTEEEDAKKVWGTFKSALSEAQDTLNKLPQRREKEWVTEEVRNLARKKRDAWQRLWQPVGVILTQYFTTSTSNIVSSQRLQQSVLGISGGATEQLCVVLYCIELLHWYST